jgi:tRNA threonylcarbamoyladenosine biosynthesis protein TsaE
MRAPDLSFGAIGEPALAELARKLAESLRGGGVIHLEGSLGAGKTTFARALLGALGVRARVKSPTYSLIESYECNGLGIQHLDLYRIAATEEVEWLGLRDYAAERQLWLIEWPERASGVIPPADLTIHLAHAGNSRDVRFEVRTPAGSAWVRALEVPPQTQSSTAS